MASVQLEAVLRHIRKLAAERQSEEKTDGALLRTFLASNDQVAFEALVRRHGPMVLRVCRRTLEHVQDAEDACQATFLVLAQRARSIRKRESLASWLHGAAYRMASHAKRSTARRHRHESRVSPAQVHDPARSAAWREIQVLLDQEIKRLPESLRAPFVLCCLENQSCAEAAAQLRLTEAAVAMRLSRARKLLQERLSRRGVSLTAVLAAVAVGANNASAVALQALIIPTAQAATRIAAGQAAAGGLVPPSVAKLAEGGLKAMCITKRKTAMVLLLAVALAGSVGGVFTYRGLAAGTGGGAAVAASHTPLISDAAQPSGETKADKQAREAQELVKGLTMKDVQWNFGTLGIMAIMKSDRAKRLVEIGEPAIPALISAMSDKNRYAPAHAILTEISKVSCKTIPYNGMSITMTADNKIVLVPQERKHLAQRWQRWYHTKPRPTTLPD
jgi:RNA polymerase sigma factor (sigma-70 family)